MLRSRLQILSQTHKGGFQNGKERVTRKRVRREEIRLKVSVQSVWRKKISTMQQTVQAPNRSLSKQRKEDDKIYNDK